MKKDAVKAASYLNENDLGRIPVLVVGTNNDDEPVANSKRYRRVLGIDRSLAKVLESVFPREMSAKVVDRLADVKPNSKDIYLTLAGDLVVSGKLFVSGNARNGDKNSSLLAFKRELRGLAREVDKSGKEIKKITASSEKVRKILAEKEDKLLDLQAFIVKVERELLSQEIQAKSLVQEIDRAERHKKVVADEIGQIEKETEQIKKRREESEKNAHSAEKARKLSGEKIDEISEKLVSVRKRVDGENATLSAKRTQAEVAAERKRSAQTALRRLETERDEVGDPPGAAGS